jgi:hypothetical protein
VSNTGRSFTVSKKEEDTFLKWRDEHDCDKQLKASKRRHNTFSFTPLGMGTSIEVRCSCGAKKDITDTDCW